MTTLYQVQASKLSGNYHEEITNLCDEFFIVSWHSVLKGCIRELAGEGRRTHDDDVVHNDGIKIWIWCNANV